MSNAAILIEGLGKQYRLGETHKRPAGGEGRETFWALRDISVEIPSGSLTGVIGRNGAGKSTLLRILSRITTPSVGRAVLRGRVASLLEVGTGFHPELTGRENIYLNGAILGMSRREINAKLDSIVAFAEIQEFVDTPVKRYSSGMYVRLAFSVAAHLEPDILLVDEVLAVGDLAFQKKCIGRMEEEMGRGRTILLVSHNMATITRLCERTMVLDRGRLLTYCDTVEAVRTYQELVSRRSAEPARNYRGPLRRYVTYLEAWIGQHSPSDHPILTPQEEIVVQVRGRAAQDVKAYRTYISVCREGTRIVTLYDAPRETVLKAGEFVSSFRLPRGFLSPGRYSVTVGGYSNHTLDWQEGEEILVFEVAPVWMEGYEIGKSMGLVNLPHYGGRKQ